MVRLRLEYERRARRQDGLVDCREPVNPGADDQLCAIGQEDPILSVGSAFPASAAERREGEIEVIAPEVAAIRQEMS